MTHLAKRKQLAIGTIEIQEGQKWSRKILKLVESTKQTEKKPIRIKHIYLSTRWK